MDKIHPKFIKAKKELENKIREFITGAVGDFESEVGMWITSLDVKYVKNGYMSCIEIDMKHNIELPICG